MKSRTIYLLLALVFAVSLAIAALPWLESAVRPVAAIPAAAATVAAVFQLLRDRMEHDRVLILHAADHQLAIGAASHMAGVAFDKHVEFAEAYVAETISTLKTFFRNGPREEAMNDAARLYALRQRSALWLTEEIDTKLGDFESAIQRIGANAHFIDVTGNDASRSAAITEMYRLFAEIMGMKSWEDQPVSQERTTAAVIAYLRGVLGVPELTALRKKLVSPRVHS